MPDKKYTINELDAQWKKYKGQKGIRFQQAGVWKTQVLDGKVPDAELAKSTRAEYVSIHQTMSFPEFLRSLK